MKLSVIINKIDCKVIGSKLKNIEGLSHLAQECKKNYIYFCLNGKTQSGSDWINTAIKNGCTVIVCEQSISLPKNITQIIVADARKEMTRIASIFYGNPADKLKIVGVTGTNGKTTTTTMLYHILSSKYSVGLIGTNGVCYADKNFSTGFTTPDPIALQQIFADMVKCGVEYVVMEYSAHAIYLQKLYGIWSHVVAFTNLSQDHLDYFENMQDYFAAKSQIFKDGCCDYSVVCTDDEYGKQIASFSKNVICCSTKHTIADIFVASKTHTTTSQAFDVCINNKTYRVNINLMGEFNIQNALVAITAALKCDMTMPQICEALKTLLNVDGRFECYSNGNITVIVDYAHTPDGLENLLKSACEVAGKNRVISVFGCGGNRDTTKRKIMGQVAQKWADYSFITTDNPRFEDSFDIANQVSEGFSKNKFKVVLDRGQALREAVDMCRSGDIVVLAGKGAENYLDINGVKVPYSDKDLVKKVLNI